MKIFYGIFLAGMVLVSASLQAQLNLSPLKTDPVPSEGITIRAISTDVSESAAPAAWAVLGPKGEIVPLQLLTGNISLPAVQKLSDHIQIYNYKALQDAFLTKTEKSNEVTLPAPLADIPVPNGATRCLIVAHPEANGWKCQVFDEGSKAYPGGSRLLINLTPYKLDGTCGSTNFDVAPRGFGLIAPKPLPKDYMTAIQIFAQLPGRKAPVLDQSWAFYPNARGIILVFEVAGGAIRTTGLADEIPVEATAADKTR